MRSMYPRILSEAHEDSGSPRKLQQLAEKEPAGQESLEVDFLRRSDLSDFPTGAGVTHGPCVTGQRCADRCCGRPGLTPGDVEAKS